MSVKVRRYRTARIVFGILAGIGWLITALGILSLVMAISMNSPADSTMPGLPVEGAMWLASIPSIIVGLLIVASHQLAIAVIDGSVAIQEAAIGLRSPEDPGRC